MQTTLALQYGLLYGLILSAVMTIIVMGSLRINNEMWLGDYPPDVQAKWGPMSAGAKRMRLWVALSMLAIVIGVLALHVAQLVRASGGQFHYGTVALSLWISLLFFNVFDLVVLDWFWLMTLKPGFAILPGTEGLAGYEDYGYHFRGFLKGTVGLTLVTPVLALLAWGVYALVA